MKLYAVAWLVQWVICSLIVLVVYLLTKTLIPFWASFILGTIIWFPVYHFLKKKYK